MGEHQDYPIPILIRGEFFNIFFNRANVTGVVGNISSSQFGTVTNAYPPGSDR